MLSVYPVPLLIHYVLGRMNLFYSTDSIVEGSLFDICILLINFGINFINQLEYSWIAVNELIFEKDRWTAENVCENLFYTT